HNMIFHLSLIPFISTAFTPITFLFFSSLLRPPPLFTLFPYTTLFRSPPDRTCPSMRNRTPRVELPLPLLPWRSWPDRNCNREKGDRKSTRLNSSHVSISYAVFCLKKKKKK